MSSFSSQQKLTLLGMVAIGGAIAVSSFGIVLADLPNVGSNMVFNCKAGTACVEGHSTGLNTKGVFGFSAGDGVEGLTRSVAGKAGVRGVSRGTAGIATGVIGSSSNGDGVVGISLGHKLDAGVRGFSNTGDGVNAETTGAGATAFHADANNATANIFVGTNPRNTGANCVIDPNANLTCTGIITGGAALRSEHRNGSGERVIAYSPESATATIEDVGTARLMGGVANVRLDPRFAAMTDKRWYYVFLTPLGDTRGLYVSVKTASGFQVRETERGRGNLEFDYRIVAHPVDASNDRLPPARE